MCVARILYKCKRIIAVVSVVQLGNLQASKFVLWSHPLQVYLNNADFIIVWQTSTILVQETVRVFGMCYPCLIFRIKLNKRTNKESEKNYVRENWPQWFRYQSYAVEISAKISNSCSKFCPQEKYLIINEINNVFFCILRRERLRPYMTMKMMKMRLTKINLTTRKTT